MTVFIIAEAGVNHDNDYIKAIRLIDSASFAGANAVKFQTYDAAKLEPPGPRRDMLARLQLSREHHVTLKQYCDAIGIEFMSTPFDVESLEFLVRLGVKRIKIASGLSQDRPFVRRALSASLPVIVSNGMSGGWWLASTNVTNLHCVSAYPAPADEMNLRAMVDLPPPYGLSDHTLGNTAAIAATALGASVIEKHITLDRSMEGPDHHMSTEPAEFAEYVKAIRECELMLGDGVKRVMPSEAKTLEIVREREAWRSRASQ